MLAGGKSGNSSRDRLVDEVVQRGDVRYAVNVEVVAGTVPEGRKMR
jgi:hypothetical protein